MNLRGSWGCDECGVLNGYVAEIPDRMTPSQVLILTIECQACKQQIKRVAPVIAWRTLAKIREREGAE